MGTKIDIIDFTGVNSFADPEDIQENATTEMENLRILDGKIDKTFGPGPMTCTSCYFSSEDLQDQVVYGDVLMPVVALDLINQMMGAEFVVVNMFTFTSNKVCGGYNYMMVLQDPNTGKTRPFWFECYPPGKPYLQIEDDIFCFWTGRPHGYQSGDLIAISGQKSTSGEYVDPESDSLVEYGVCDWFTEQDLGGNGVSSRIGVNVSNIGFKGPFFAEHGGENIEFTSGGLTTRGYYQRHHKPDTRITSGVNPDATLFPYFWSIRKVISFSYARNLAVSFAICDNAGVGEGNETQLFYSTGGSYTHFLGSTYDDGYQDAWNDSYDGATSLRDLRISGIQNMQDGDIQESKIAHTSYAFVAIQYSVGLVKHSRILRLQYLANRVSSVEVFHSDTDETDYGYGTTNRYFSCELTTTGASASYNAHTSPLVKMSRSQCFVFSGTQYSSNLGCVQLDTTYDEETGFTTTTTVTGDASAMPMPPTLSGLTLVGIKKWRWEEGHEPPPPREDSYEYPASHHFVAWYNENAPWSTNNGPQIYVSSKISDWLGNEETLGSVTWSELNSGNNYPWDNTDVLASGDGVQACKIVDIEPMYRSKLGHGIASEALHVCFLTDDENSDDDFFNRQWFRAGHGVTDTTLPEIDSSIATNPGVIYKGWAIISSGVNPPPFVWDDHAINTSVAMNSGSEAIEWITKVGPSSGSQVYPNDSRDDHPDHDRALGNPTFHLMVGWSAYYTETFVDPSYSYGHYGGGIRSMNVSGVGITTFDRGTIPSGKTFSCNPPTDAVFLTKYAKAYMVWYGTNSSSEYPDPDPEQPDITAGSGDVYRMTDIGWRSQYGPWGTTGLDNLTYGFRDVAQGFVNEFDEEIYQKVGKNAVVLSDNQVRFTAGDIGINVHTINPQKYEPAIFMHIDRVLFNQISVGPDFIFSKNKIDPVFKFSGAGLEQLDTEDIHDSNAIKYAISTMYDANQESLLGEHREFIGIPGTDRDIAKCRISLRIDADTNTMNKRITGMRIYRSKRYLGTWEPYKQIVESSFIGDQNPFGHLNLKLSSIYRDHAYVYDPDNSIYHATGGGDTGGEPSYGLSIGNNSTNYHNIVSNGLTKIEGVADTGIRTTADMSDTSQEMWVTDLRSPDNTSPQPFDLGLMTAPDSHTDHQLPSDEDRGVTAGHHDKVLLGNEHMQITSIGGDNYDELHFGDPGDQVACLDWDPDENQQYIFDFSGVDHEFLVAENFTSHYGGDVIEIPNSADGTHGVEYMKVIGVDPTAHAIEVQRGWNHTLPVEGPCILETPIRRRTNGNTHGGVGIPNYNKLCVVTRNMNPDYSGQNDGSEDFPNTNVEHGEGSYIKTGVEHASGWWKVNCYHSFDYDYAKHPWALHKWIWRLYGGEWERRATGTNAWCGNNSIGYITPMESFNKDTQEHDMAPWTDQGGSIDMSPVIGYNLMTQDTDVTTDPDGVPDSGDEVTVTTAGRGIYRVDYMSHYSTIGTFAMVMVNKDTGGVEWTCNAVVRGQLVMEEKKNMDGSGTGIFSCEIMDEGFISLGEHPYQFSPSITVNGKFARVIKGRLFYGGVVLDPDEKAEAHPDWIAYSEFNQYDVFPVSNVIIMTDREGGPITGLAEMFGRLIVFKKQAIFMISLTSPADPTTWTRNESKMNLGNIAEDGIVEVLNSVFFVYHDGIYRIDTNTMADSNTTPAPHKKVSWEIEDQFNKCIDKTAIKGVFSRAEAEVHYYWKAVIGTVGGEEVIGEKCWAFSLTKKIWREITLGNIKPDLIAQDETGLPFMYDSVTKGLFGYKQRSLNGIKWKSKKFVLDLHKKMPIRYLTTQFTGEEVLTAKIFLDGEESPSFVKNDISHGSGESKLSRFPVKRYAKKMNLQLETPESNKDFSLERLQIELGD